jgi:metallo-beta-lactamase class B
MQDRMGGINVINKQQIPSYCSQKTIRIAGRGKLPHPAHGFSDSLALKVCRFAGAGHTKDNIVVWLPDEKVLFGGCLVKDSGAQTLGYIKDADMKAWPLTIQNLIRLFPDAATVVPGHFNYGNKELLYHTLELLKKQAE